LQHSANLFSEKEDSSGLLCGKKTCPRRGGEVEPFSQGKRGVDSEWKNRFPGQETRSSRKGRANLHAQLQGGEGEDHLVGEKKRTCLQPKKGKGKILKWKVHSQPPQRLSRFRYSDSYLNKRKGGGERTRGGRFPPQKRFMISGQERKSRKDYDLKQLLRAREPTNSSFTGEKRKITPEGGRAPHSVF